MGWDNTNKLMYSPLTTWDVAAALGVSTGDLGYAIANGTINKWAKYKPVRAAINSPGFLLDTARKAVSYGLTIPHATTAAGLVALYDSSLTNPVNGWVYNVPRGKGYGGSSPEWFRMYDFLKVTSGGAKDDTVPGYNSTAPNPFGKFGSPASVSYHGGTLWCENDWLRGVTKPEYQLAISDFNTLPNLYYGFVFYANNAPFYVATADQTITQGGTLVRGNEILRVEAFLDRETFDTNADYKIYPILCTVGGIHDTNNGVIPHTWSERDSETAGLGTMYPIPGAAPNFVSVYSHSILINITAPKATRQSDGTYIVEFNFSIKNNTDRTYRVNGDKVMLRYRNGEYDESTIISPIEKVSSIASLVNNVQIASGASSPQYHYTSEKITSTDIQRVWVGIFYGSGTTIDIPIQESVIGIMYPAQN